MVEIIKTEKIDNEYGVVIQKYDEGGYEVCISSIKHPDSWVECDGIYSRKSEAMVVFNSMKREYGLASGLDNWSKGSGLQWWFNGKSTWGLKKLYIDNIVPSKGWRVVVVYSYDNAETYFKTRKQALSYARKVMEDYNINR